MKRRVTSIVTICASVLLIGACSGTTNQESSQTVNRGLEMATIELELPFGLTEADLRRVEIMYAFYSAKTGAGRQEMTISGTGKVTLLMTRTMGDPPTILEGTLDVKIVTGLLGFMSDQGFLGFDDVYPTTHAPHARRVLKLVLPGQTKTVALDEPGFTAFEMVAGAVKFAASLARPEALNNRFFPNL